ncbi:MAG: phosphoenolpyruvate mutase [Chlamydiales bacterium]|nr:phosphoenolpyruvate mutase [Chlamydiales bacterium]
MKKSTCLNKILNESTLDFFLEAHNALSAKIVEDAGFKGIWASGLSLAATFGVRDNNELSWTQSLEVLEFMSDATSIPILFDGDTGYGNFNNVRRLVSKLEKLGVAGVCLEDKVFPKVNSFRTGKNQQLCSIEEFCGKIKAAKDTVQDSDFCLIARTEEFITGGSIEGVLERCTAYVKAGADAVLVHSKKSHPEQIRTFMNHWDRSCPVVILPTTFYETPSTLFGEWGVSLILWANHMVRASIYHMRKVAGEIYSSRSVADINSEIATLEDIFKFQNADELDEAEKLYLP